MRLLATIAAFSLIAPVAGAADPSDLPSLGDATSGIVSPAAERELARAALKQIRAGAPLAKDPILKYYVHVNIHRLAEKSALRDVALTTVLIDSPQINAFAVPGGIVGVNLGLLLHAEDESEYSAVIAHELAHLSQRHYARGFEAQRAMTPWMLAGLLASIVIGAAGGSEAGLAAAASTQALIADQGLRFSRAREQEADRIGLNTLVAAGMDPDGMARMFERMRRAYRFVEKPPEFLLTHPLTDSRISDARNQAERFASGERATPGERLASGAAAAPEATGPRASPLDYAFMRARVQVRYAESARRALAEATARTGGGDADNYAIALALAKEGREEDAVDAVRILHREHADSLLMTASFAELLIGAEQTDEAIALLARELAIAPDNEPLTFLYARALQVAERPGDAADVLWRHVRVNPQDVDVWELLAEISGLAGDTIGVHRARAEYFALVGAYRMAIQHLDYAMRLVRAGDERMTARLAQRIIDLRTELEALREERAG